jgi:hypothetical protein
LSEEFEPIDTALLAKASGVPQAQIELAQKDISAFLQTGATVSVDVNSTCRLGNGGIVKLPPVPKKIDPKNKVISFIPAAGAASRYFAPMQNIITAIKNADKNSFDKNWLELAKYPLPKSVRSLSEESAFENATLLKQALEELSLPKALMPCNQTANFLQEKYSELDAYGFITEKFFVIPPNTKAKFKESCPSSEAKFFIQDAELSTLRFDGKGKVLLNEGVPSVAPAGHGALHALLPKLYEEGHRHAFIQNIDNLTGTKPEVIEALKAMHSFYTRLYSSLERIRANIANDFQAAESEAGSALSKLGIKPDSASALQTLFHDVFKRPSNLPIEKSAFDSLQVLGMVPNKDGFVGGIPFYWDSGHGLAKICLEGPHLSGKAKSMLKDQVSYFNPVTVLSELKASGDSFAEISKDFWFVADKTYQGRRALYRETALYELLSDSRHHNVVFVELPEFLFRPHKTIFDCAKAL